MRLVLTTVFYCFVMLLVSSIYNSTIMDPVQLLWVLCYFLVGPELLITSAVLLVRGVVRHSMRPAQMVATGLSIITVVVWTFGFWRIGELLRPVSFRLVAGENERLAISFMQQHPPDSEVRLSGFRYPYCALGNTRVTHHDGSVFVMVPSGPGPKDSLVYVSQGSKVPDYSKHLTGLWYYSPATPN